MKLYIIVPLLFHLPQALAVVHGSSPSEDDPIRAVTLQIDLGGGSCTGTLISAHWAVTAAHCADHKGVAVIRPDGSHSRIVRMISMPSKAGIPHQPSDVALVEIKSPMPPPYAKVASPETMPKPGDTISIAGYGVTGETRHDDGNLLKADLHVKESSPEDPEVLTDGHRRGSCYGDSGGPGYQVKNGSVLLWGVCHGGVTICGEGSVYENIGVARNWILSKTGLRDEVPAPPVEVASMDPSFVPAAPPAAPIPPVPPAPSVPLAVEEPQASCGREINCTALKTGERSALIEAFYRDRRPEANICISGGTFSKYKQGIKRKGGCEIVYGDESGRCKADQALCSPVLFCTKQRGERKVGPSCTAVGGAQSYAITKNCNADFAARLRAGASECDPADVDPVFREHWSELRERMKTQFAATCLQNKGFQALFCSQCQILSKRLTQLNLFATGRSCREDVPRAPASPSPAQADR